MGQGRARAAASLCSGFESLGGQMRSVCKRKVEHDEQAHNAPIFSHVSRWELPHSVEVPGSFLCAAYSWICVSVRRVSAHSCLLLKKLKAMYGANPCSLTIHPPTRIDGNLLFDSVAAATDS